MTGTVIGGIIVVSFNNFFQNIFVIFPSRLFYVWVV